MVGTVKWFSDSRGYGFILAENREVFVHYSDIVQTAGRNTFRKLREGQTVSFDLESVDNGNVKAVNVSVVA